MNSGQKLYINYSYFGRNSDFLLHARISIGIDYKVFPHCNYIGNTLFLPGEQFVSKAETNCYHVGYCSVTAMLSTC